MIHEFPLTGVIHKHSIVRTQALPLVPLVSKVLSGFKIIERGKDCSQVNIYNRRYNKGLFTEAWTIYR